MDKLISSFFDIWNLLFSFRYYIVILIFLKYVCKVIIYYSHSEVTNILTINFKSKILELNVQLYINKEEIQFYIHQLTIFIYNKTQYYLSRNKKIKSEINYKTWIPNNTLISYYNINSTNDCLKVIFGCQSICHGRVLDDRYYPPRYIENSNYHQKGYVHTVCIKPCLYKSNDYYIYTAIELYLKMSYNINLETWIQIIKYVKQDDLKNQFNLPNNNDYSLYFEIKNNEQIALKAGTGLIVR